MKVRVTVTIDFDDPHDYDYDMDGQPTADLGRVTREAVAEYVASAVKSWGGQLPPASVFFPTNIKDVVVRY